MEAIPKSGLYYPNQTARLALQNLEALTGRNGLKAVLNLAHLPELIDNYPPADLERSFDFADLSAILGALEELYGARGAGGFALRVGAAALADALPRFPPPAQAGIAAPTGLPLPERLRQGIPLLAEFFSQFSDQLSSAEEREDDFVFVIHNCPACWGRTTAKPACHFVRGMLQEGLKNISGGVEVGVTQTAARSAADAACVFIIDKAPPEV